MSDWFAQHTGIASALGGFDMVMPSGITYWAPSLTEAVPNASVPESRITDMATRIMAAWFFTHQDNSDTPVAVGFTSKYLQPYRVVDARDSNDAGTLLQGAIEGHVLVENTNETLPLQNPQIMSVFGYDARPPDGNTPNIGNSG